MPLTQALTGFRGTVNGAVQTTYTDQPRQAYAGQLAFSSDTNLLDAYIVGDSRGVFAAQGVRLDPNTSTELGNLQSPNLLVNQPIGDGSETAADFGGIVVFDEAMQSDSNGNPGWNQGRNARIGRPKRAGVRVWVPCADAVTAFTSTVNWVTKAGTDGVHALGGFAAAALDGTATHGTSVAITNAQWVTSAPAGGMAIIELSD